MELGQVVVVQEVLEVLLEQEEREDPGVDQLGTKERGHLEVEVEVRVEVRVELVDMDKVWSAYSSIPPVLNFALTKNLQLSIQMMILRMIL